MQQFTLHQSLFANWLEFAALVCFLCQFAVVCPCEQQNRANSSCVFCIVVFWCCHSKGLWLLAQSKLATVELHEICSTQQSADWSSNGALWCSIISELKKRRGHLSSAGKSSHLHQCALHCQQPHWHCRKLDGGRWRVYGSAFDIMLWKVWPWCCGTAMDLDKHAVAWLEGMSLLSFERTEADVVCTHLL